MSDTPETDAAAFDAFDGQGGDEVVFANLARRFERERNEARNKAHNYEQGYLTHAARADTLEKERDEAREALRVLFDDYKQLADSGDAGFWELEDKEATQPALRILQQKEDATPTTKHE